MMQRTVASQQAAQAAQDMRALLDGPMRQQMQQLLELGRRLSEPAGWDGRLASDFRQETWPRTGAALARALTAVDQLQLHAQRVVLDIVAAGGGALPGAAGGPLLLAPGALAGYRAAGLLTAGAWDDAGRDWWGRPNTLARHLRDHGADFGITSEDAYAREASAFLRGAHANGYQIKVDADGVIRVYDPATNTFGAYSADGTTRTFYKPTSPTYFARQPGIEPTGADAARIEQIAAEAGTSPATRVAAFLESPTGRAVRGGLTGLAVAGDAYAIVHPSPDALGGANLERGMAAANLTAIAVTAAPMAELLAVNAATDWIPGVGEVVMAGTALYLAGDFVYQNREAIGHGLSVAGDAVADVSTDVARGAWHGAEHAWHSLFG